MHPADKFLLIRKHVFSTFNKYGLKVALKTIDNYVQKGELDANHCKGIRAELGFYADYQKKYSLWESLDSGNHADFIGSIDNKTFGIDVTTNIETKDLTVYSGNQEKGYNYLIALVNPETLKLEEIFDINFPFCQECGGRLIDILFLEPSDRDKEGFANYQFTQKLIKMCSHTPDEHSTIIAETYNHTFDIPTYMKEYHSLFDYDDESNGPFDFTKEIENYSISNLKYYQKSFDVNLMACSSPDYIITNPMDGDGDWGTKLYFKRPFLNSELDSHYDFDFRDIY